MKILTVIVVSLTFSSVICTRNRNPSDDEGSPTHHNRHAMDRPAALLQRTFDDSGAALSNRPSRPMNVGDPESDDDASYVPWAINPGEEEDDETFELRQKWEASKELAWPDTEEEEEKGKNEQEDKGLKLAIEHLGPNNVLIALAPENAAHPTGDERLKKVVEALKKKMGTQQAIEYVRKIKTDPPNPRRHSV